MDVIVQFLINLARGAAVGIANIIPGVSGGTMALILGIYERLITAIGNIGPASIKNMIKGRKAFMEEMRRLDVVFLGTLGAAAVVTIVVVAGLMKYLLLNQHDPTYGFFFGLVLVSVVVPWRMMKRKSAGAMVAAVLAVIMVVGLTLAMSGEEQLASTRKKACLKLARTQAKAAIKAPGSPAATKPLPRVCDAVVEANKGKKVAMDIGQLVFFFFAGAIAISAMILPGISGSFMLLLMGIYFDMLNCINAVRLGVTARQFGEITEPAILLAVFSFGCLLGLLLFTRLLKFLLRKFHDVTLAFLTGLIVGSLYAIWPFKEAKFAIPGNPETRVDLQNVLPASVGGNELLTLLSVVLGAAIVAGFVWYEVKSGKTAKH